MWFPILLSGVCLIIEAFFSSAEIAIVSADRAHIRDLAAAGHRGARLVEDFLIAPHRLLSATLLGTQLAVVVQTVVWTLWLHEHHPHHVELLLLLGLTPVVVIFGEIVPKAIVRQHANRVAPVQARILSVVMRLLSPGVYVLERVSKLATARLGIDVHHKLVTREEIESLVSAQSDSGGDSSVSQSDVTEGERSMIARIFDFPTLRADDVMKPLSDVVAQAETASVAQLAREIADKKYSRIPIYRERLDQIVGVVHAFDVLKSGRSDGVAKDLMREPLYAPESCPALDLLVRLERAHQGMAIIVDEYGGAVGLVTVEDLLEQVVGEIADEYDEEPPALSRQRDGSYRVQARIAVEQLNRELKLSLPESDDYESLGGLLLERLKRIPRPGEVVKIAGVSFEIAAANERRVEEVVLRLGRK
ncbi:MAG: HlyC/CorC family transporter [Myxococcales bacterium]|jgi:putative hemolysin|nr:HlyC/CorC family transporter [Myxococcales bacterium]